jgi:cytochrome c-type biogenesis protein CcmH
MLLWVIFAALTSFVLAAILWPFVRGSAGAPGRQPHALAVCRDQLAELEGDEARGLISPREAEAARNKVSRRLIAAARPAEVVLTPSRSWSLAVAIACAFAVPAVSLAVYFMQGRPDLPGVPYAERIAGALANNDIAALIVRVEAHLAQRPDDIEGWRAIAPAYRSLGRYDDAAKAFSRILSLSEPSAALHADLGEALTQDAQGLVTEAAVRAFDDALRIDPENVKARFFRALAHQQDGAIDLALRQWQALLASAPADAAWRSAVEAEIAKAHNGYAAPELSDEQLAESQSLSPQNRLAMIRSMVDGLAERLARDGNDLSGWLRLAKARLVLGEPEEARRALDRAQDEFSGDVAALARIEQMRRSLPR